MPSSRCIVSNCDGIHSVQHYLPSNEAKREKWLQALDRKDLIEKDFTTLRSLKVCGDHFDLTNYRNADSFMLNRNAVPIAIKKEETLPPTTEQSEKKDEEQAPRIHVGKKYKCIVSNCKVTVRPFHNLPKNKELRGKWLRNVDRMDMIDIPYSTLKNTGVCATHFDVSQYYYAGCARLLRTAVPRPLNPDTETCKNERKDIVEDLIKDAAISTGTVTAPLLCHNKVLLKTKSTYSKNNYKMTFNEDTSSQMTDKKQKVADLPLVISDVFQVFDDDDDDDTPDSSNITPSTKPVTLEYSSILKEKLTNSKKRKYMEIEEDTDVDEYDDKLFSLLEQVKSLPNFLDIIFGFLYRRTDYFQTSSDQNIGVGLPNGVAQKLLWQAFKKYENKHNEDMSTPRKEETDVQTKASDDTEKSSSSNKETKSEEHLFETYNGAVFENYAWSQSICDVDIQIKIPDKVTCKQLDIDISGAQITIKLKDSETVYLTGDLCKKCKTNETVWSLGGHILQIHLEKQFDSWWDCLLKAEPRLDFNKMDYPRPFQELLKEPKIPDPNEEITFDDIKEETAFVEQYDPLIEMGGFR